MSESVLFLKKKKPCFCYEIIKVLEIFARTVDENLFVNNLVTAIATITAIICNTSYVISVLFWPLIKQRVFTTVYWHELTWVQTCPSLSIALVDILHLSDDMRSLHFIFDASSSRAGRKSLSRRVSPAAGNRVSRWPSFLRHTTQPIRFVYLPNIEAADYSSLKWWR